MVSHSQSMHGDNHKIGGFHGPAVCDLDNSTEVILSKCLIWGEADFHLTIFSRCDEPSM